MLHLDFDAYQQMVGHAYDGFPDEACGLLGGKYGSDLIEMFVPCANTDASSRTYSIGPTDWAAAETQFEVSELDIVGVMHSHTHTDAYPSVTDIDKADNPLLIGWHYIIVSLSQAEPMLRCYLLDDRNIVEESVVLTNR